MILIKALREIAYAIGVFFVAGVVGVIIWLASAWVIPNIDRSREAESGFGLLFGLVVMIAHIVRRIMKARKRASPAPG